MLAAGESRRLTTEAGCPKQLLRWGEWPLLTWVVRQTLATRLRPVVVVLGHRAQEVREVLPAPEEGVFDIVLNPDYTSGQASSVRCGVCHLLKGWGTASTRVDGVLFVLGDQPLVPASTMDRIADYYRALQGKEGTRAIVVPVHRGHRGNPVLFGAAFFSELLDLRGDEGGRSLIRRYPESVHEVEAGPEVLVDIDTPGDYALWRRGTTPVDR